MPQKVHQQNGAVRLAEFGRSGAAGERVGIKLKRHLKHISLKNFSINILKMKLAIFGTEPENAFPEDITVHVLEKVSKPSLAKCPCTPMTAFPTGNTACSGLTKKVPYTIQKPFMEPTTCTTRFSMENSNFRQSFYYKNDKLGREVTTGGWLDKDGNCQIAEFPTGSQDTNGAFYRLGFHCNLTSGAWYNSWANTEILPCVNTTFA
nr:hypothetical protein Y64G10A.a - Caenorhabditis elegans [Caenorhabditis elegans]